MNIKDRLPVVFLVSTTGVVNQIGSDIDDANMTGPNNGKWPSVCIQCGRNTPKTFSCFRLPVARVTFLQFLVARVTVPVVSGCLGYIPVVFLLPGLLYL